MKKWESAAVVGLFSLVIGAILVAWGVLTAEAIQLEQIGVQITASLNPAFIIPVVFGTFFLGLGFGLLGCLSTVNKLEKQPLPPPPS